VQAIAFCRGLAEYARRAEVSAPCSGSDRDIGRASNTSKIDNTSKMDVAARMQAASAFDTRAQEITVRQFSKWPGRP
jgi:hypothetical protein